MLYIIHMLQYRWQNIYNTTDITSFDKKTQTISVFFHLLASLWDAFKRNRQSWIPPNQVLPPPSNLWNDFPVFVEVQCDLFYLYERKCPYFRWYIYHTRRKSSTVNIFNKLISQILIKWRENILFFRQFTRNNFSLDITNLKPLTVQLDLKEIR